MNRKSLLDDIAASIRRDADPVSGALHVRREILAAFFRNADTPLPRPAQARIPVPEPTPEKAVRTAPPKITAEPKPEAAPVFKAVPRTDISGLDLNGLRLSAGECRACPLCQFCTKPVFGAGNPGAEIMFIDKAPGPEADAIADPYAGAAGELLLKMIQAMKLDRSRVYFTFTVKCRPEEDRTPSDPEMSACLPLLENEIRAVRPKVIVLLGSAALKAVMEKNKISQVRGTWMEYEGIPVMPTFNPAYLLRVPKAKRDVWNDLQLVMAKLETQA